MGSVLQGLPESLLGDESVWVDVGAQLAPLRVVENGKGVAHWSHEPAPAVWRGRGATHKPILPNILPRCPSVRSVLSKPRPTALQGLSYNSLFKSPYLIPRFILGLLSSLTLKISRPILVASTTALGRLFHVAHTLFAKPYLAISSRTPPRCFWTKIQNTFNFMELCLRLAR